MNVTLTLAGSGNFVLRGLQASPGLVQAGTRRAVNRTLSRARTQGAKGIGQRLHLKGAYIRERMETFRATAQTPTALLRVRKRETRMDRFPHRQLTTRGRNGGRKPAGIQVRIRKDRAPKVLRSAFLVPLKKGKRSAGAGGFGIAVRTSVLQQLGYGRTLNQSNLGGSGSRRYEVLHTTSLADAMRDVLGAGLNRELDRYYRQQMDSEMKRALERTKRK